MTQEAKAIIEDIAGMFDKLLKVCSEEPEVQEVDPAYVRKGYAKASKQLLQENLQGVRFTVIGEDGTLSFGAMSSEWVKELLKTYVEKYG